MDLQYEQGQVNKDFHESETTIKTITLRYLTYKKAF